MLETFAFNMSILLASFLPLTLNGILALDDVHQLVKLVAEVLFFHQLAISLRELHSLLPQSLYPPSAIL